MSVSWARRLVVIVPDGENPPASLNIQGKHPPVHVVYHSQFIPVSLSRYTK
jgi:hypothetical protein